MLFFFISNSFLIASYNLPSKLISPAAQVVLSHIFNPVVQCKPCAIVQQLSAHSPQTFPMAMLARKVIPAGLVTPPVPGPPARLSMGPGRVSGMVPMPAVPQHTFHWGWRGCQGLQQVCSRAMKAKIPWLFVIVTKLARARNVHTAALAARGRSQEAGPAICVYRGSVTSRYMDSHLQDLMGHLQLQLCLTSSNYSDSLTFSCNSVQRGTLWMGASRAGEVAESMRSTQPS